MAMLMHSLEKNQMIIERLHDKIIYYKNALDNPASIIDKIESLDSRSRLESQIPKWSTWTASDNNLQVYGYEKEGMVSNQRFGCDMDLQYAIIINNIHYISDICLSHYCNVTSSVKPFLPDHFSIRKYVAGAEMGNHVDSEDPTDTSHPVLSGVFYLNDSYEGGEIEFPNQNLKIKPEAGSLLIFPSERPFFHTPAKVVSGNKYMIPFFWYRNL